MGRTQRTSGAIKRVGRYGQVSIGVSEAGRYVRIEPRGDGVFLRFIVMPDDAGDAARPEESAAATPRPMDFLEYNDACHDACIYGRPIPPVPPELADEPLAHDAFERNTRIAPGERPW